jgi:hypothetical protein
MTTPPPTTHSQAWPDGERAPIPLVGSERELLTAYLDKHRETLALKCEGVPPGKLDEQLIPPSTLSLHGLVRHLAGVERWWFQTNFADPDAPDLFYSDDDPDQDFEPRGADFAADLAIWRAEVDKSRATVAAAESLDVTGVHRDTGKTISLRRILIHMLSEYAQHNGHVDLLREQIDGKTGV